MTGDSRTKSTYNNVVLTAKSILITIFAHIVKLIENFNKNCQKESLLGIMPDFIATTIILLELLSETLKGPNVPKGEKYR